MVPFISPCVRAYRSLRENVHYPTRRACRGWAEARKPTGQTRLTSLRSKNNRPVGFLQRADCWARQPRSAVGLLFAGQPVRHLRDVRIRLCESASEHVSLDTP
jgi:hypothetical protein